MVSCAAVASTAPSSGRQIKRKAQASRSASQATARSGTQTSSQS